jgi:hypothetical protein
MPHHHDKTASGIITHIFGHRFVLKTQHGDLLADLTPNGLQQIALCIGDEVVVDGEMKPSELKVMRLTRGGSTVLIDHKKKPHEHHHHHPHADPSIVLAAARTAGFAVVGEPRRKPKHFEVLGRKKEAFSELHIELDGHIRKSKPVAGDDHKWLAEMRAVAID